MKAQFTQKITGTSERKTLLAPIAEKAGQSVQYAGAPSFAYTAAGWLVDKNGVVSSPVFEIESALELNASLLELLRDAGTVPEGQLTVTIIPDDVDENRATIMQALLRSKESLICAAFGTYKKLVVTPGDIGYSFAFYNATLDHAYITAAIQFAYCIHEQSFQQKRVTSKDKPVDNEKYAFRCFLLRIGMIGKEYSLARKTLLAALSGNSSFKSGERKQQTEASELPATEMNSLAEALADAELIHGVNALIEAEGSEGMHA